jgi:hypothetical protein
MMTSANKYILPSLPIRMGVASSRAAADCGEPFVAVQNESEMEKDLEIF